MSFDNPYAEYVPEPSTDGMELARVALWAEMASEERRRRIRLTRARVVIVAGVVFLVWTGGPAQIGGNRLAGLADAVAEDGAPAASGSPTVWYEKITYSQTHEVPRRLLRPLQVDAYQFSVPIVTETWLAPDGALRTRTIYGEPTFAAGVDQRIFDLLRLSDRYPVGVVVERLGQDEAHITLPWDQGAEEVGEVMLRHVATSGSKRPTSVQMLDVSLELFKEERDVPAHRAILFRVLSAVPGLWVSDAEGGLLVTTRYVEGDSAYEKQVLIDRTTGALLSHSVVRLATASHEQSFLYLQQFGVGHEFPLIPGETEREPVSVSGQQ